MDNKFAMSMSEWMSYLTELGVLDDTFPEKLGPFAHALGSQINVSEASSKVHLEIEVSEFLLAFAYVFYARCGPDGTAQLPQVLEHALTRLNTDLSQRMTEWQGFSLSGRTDVHLQHWRVGVKWLTAVWALVEHIFAVADDNSDGVLSVRELRFAFADQDILDRLESAGIEIEHVAAFFQYADVDGDGTLTPVETLQGFARVKEQLKRDESALELLREAFNLTGNPEQPVDKSLFEKAVADRSITAKMKLLQMDFSLMDFYSFCVEKRVASNKSIITQPATLEEVLCWYLEFRDPQRTGQELIIYLRNLFQRADLDGNGTLELYEFVAVLGEPETVRELHRLGLVESVFGAFDVGDGSLEHFKEIQDQLRKNLEEVFIYLDEDGSGGIDVEELLTWFEQSHSLTRHRILDNHFSSTTAVVASSPFSHGRSIFPDSGASPRASTAPHKRMSALR